jgi:hypothetical protein
MSLTSPAHARNLQTNINASRYFFATQEAGEQELFLSTIGGGGPNGNISSLAVGISGPAGNAVVVSEGPSYMASEFISADQGAVFGSGSTYWTASTITSTITGVSLSTDRFPGSGIGSIEAYAGNGSTGGFEFLSRGVNSALISTTSVDANNYISSIGRPGATAVLGSSGTLVTAAFQGPLFNNVQSESGAGAGCYTISDLSGGSQVQTRWSIGKSGAITGSNAGSDLNFFAYADSGNYLGNWIQLKRSDGSMAIQNISSISASLGGTSKGQVFPMKTDNTEFGADSNVVIVAGATSNQSLFGSVWAPLFSTPVSSLNPNYETLLNINWANTLSTGSNHVNFKIGFSTATAYTNIIQTSYVPGLGGSFTPSDQPGVTSPIGHTNICCVVDPDGLTAQGDGVLYVAGQFSDPAAAADQLFIAKGLATESTRNALTYKTI